MWNEIKDELVYERLGTKFSLNRFVGTAKNAVTLTLMWSKKQYGFEVYLLHNGQMTGQVLQAIQEDLTYRHRHHRVALQCSASCDEWVAVLL